MSTNRLLTKRLPRVTSLMSGEVPSATRTKSAGGTDTRYCVRSPERFRLGAKAFLTSGDEVLIVKEAHADGRAFWTLPGGGLHPGETLVDCLRREVAEELQCRLRVDGPATLCRYDHRSRHDSSLYAVFRGSVRSEPVPSRGEGILAAEWVPRTDPPEGLLSPFRRLFDVPARAETD